MARKQKTIHYIYKTTCIITGRWYVGMHSTSKLDDGYMGSGKLLRYSMRKYGIDNHIKEILEFSPTRELLKEREKELVNKELIGDGKCMNLKEGGDGGFVNEEHMLKCSIAGNIAKKNKLATDLVYRENYINKCSLSLKKYNESGKNNSPRFTGKSHSDKTKKLIGDKAKERTGDKNSQFGTCWITKDGVNKKIKKEDLDKWLNENWVKGRKSEYGESHRVGRTVCKIEPQYSSSLLFPTEYR